MKRSRAPCRTTSRITSQLSSSFPARFPSQRSREFGGGAALPTPLPPLSSPRTPSGASAVDRRPRELCGGGKVAGRAALGRCGERRRIPAAGMVVAFLFGPLAAASSEFGASFSAVPLGFASSLSAHRGRDVGEHRRGRLAHMFRTPVPGHGSFVGLRASRTPPSPPSLEGLTVPELKARLRERNLPVSGRKAELIERLRGSRAPAAEGDPSSSSAAPPSARKRAVRPKPAPPRDETNILVVQKEVEETVRALEGLKISRDGSPSADAESLWNSLSSASDSVVSSVSEKAAASEGPVGAVSEEAAREELERVKAMVRKATAATVGGDALTREEWIRRIQVRPANDIKVELGSLRLPAKGRKPELVRRLADHYTSVSGGYRADGDEHHEDDDGEEGSDEEVSDDRGPAPDAFAAAAKRSAGNADRPVVVSSFAGISPLSAAASDALTRAGFGSTGPTPIQSAAVPRVYSDPTMSALLHAPTGSGKTLAYLLPLTETLWREVKDGTVDESGDDLGSGVAIVLLPTRELAAQVAGVASVLAPPGTVRLVSGPTDLAGSAAQDMSEESSGGRVVPSGREVVPRILVGSARSVATSLFGDGRMPAPPTRKPDGKELLSRVRWLVLDEVDRLLNVKKSRSEKTFKRHEKPTAVIAAAVARLTVGRVQVVAASATVGRPLRRELSRVLGLHSSECPETIRGGTEGGDGGDDSADGESVHVVRAVTIPDEVRNYVLPVEGSTAGSLLTSAAFAAKNMLRYREGTGGSRKVLFVITRGSDIKVQNALGALRHFGIRPEPRSLLDVLEADGTDRLIEVHRKVSGATGVGESSSSKPMASPLGDDEGDGGYLLVTHEDSIRGLHLDGLDTVVVCGRPGGPDEYTHIAGRTGRAGRKGSVINVVSFAQAAALTSWAKMLNVDFIPVDEDEVAKIE